MFQELSIFSIIIIFLFVQENQELPKSIIVYRDGVSDGQLTLVQDFEVPQLMKVFRNFDGYDPKLSFVVVQKRINTRIYSQLSGGNLGNPPPGSIMDHTVTKRKWYDCYRLFPPIISLCTFSTLL